MLPLDELYMLIPFPLRILGESEHTAQAKKTDLYIIDTPRGIYVQLSIKLCTLHVGILP